MTRSSTISPEAQTLLEAEREVPPTPAAVRARTMARARAALKANAWMPAVARVSTRVSRSPSWAAAAVLVCVASAAAAATAYGIRAYLKPVSPADGGARAIVTSAPARYRSHPAVSVEQEDVQNSLDDSQLDDAAAESSTGDESPAPNLTRRRHLLTSPTDAMRDELRLLRRARAAVAREDFAGALPPIAEHTRRYRKGRLSEEREALRVKALVGLGRSEDARRAAGSFRARFPHSVLLPAVSQMPASRP